MKRSESEEALGSLYDEILKLVDMVENKLLEGKGSIPEGIMEDLEKVWEDICELRRRDYRLRKQLGINEESFQASIKGEIGLNPYRKRLLRRVAKLDADLRHKMAEAEMDLRAISGGQLEKEKEALREESLKRLNAIRRAGKDSKWKEV